MSKSQNSGRPISLVEAKRYVEAFGPIKVTTVTKILAKLNDADRRDPLVAKTETHHRSEANAFIFDAKHVMRFFTGGQSAKYLMVLLAADYQTSEPTVVVAGVNEDPSDPNAFVSLDMTDPATQHPPKKVLTTFPDPEKGTDQQLVITLL